LVNLDYFPKRVSANTKNPLSQMCGKGSVVASIPKQSLLMFALERILPRLRILSSPVLLNLAANFSGGVIAFAGVGRRDPVISMDVDVGIACIHLLDQGAERLAR